MLSLFIFHYLDAIFASYRSLVKAIPSQFYLPCDYATGHGYQENISTRLLYCVATKRVPGLSYGVVCVILRLSILVQCRLVTDGKTDGHTTSAYTALAQRRAVINEMSSGIVDLCQSLNYAVRLMRGYSVTAVYESALHLPGFV